MGAGGRAAGASSWVQERLLHRMTAVLLVTLGLLYLRPVVMGRHLSGYQTTLGGFLGGLAVLAALKMWRDNCFESRLTAGLLTGATALGQVLVVTVGMPGSTPSPWTPSRVTLVMVAAGIAGLIASGASCRRGKSEVAPYAV